MGKVYLVRILANSQYGLKKGQFRVGKLSSACDDVIYIRYGKGRLDWTVYPTRVVSLVRELPNTDFFAAK